MSATTSSAPRAAFGSMETSTEADWKIIVSQFLPYAKQLPNRVLDHLRLLDGDFGGKAGSVSCSQPISCH